MIKNSFKEKIKNMLIGGTLLTAMHGTLTFAASTIDVTPPRGKLEIKNIVQIENVNYINSKDIEVEVNAKDDICADTEIKYYISTSPISNTTEITDSLWKNYSPGVIEKITLPDVNNTLYVVFKDASGNTSIIYNGTNLEYTFIYDKNADDATMFSSTVGTTTYHGMPYVVTTQEPMRDDYYFAGWSTTPNATTASYAPGEVIPASAFVGGGKTITLYAVWSQSTEGLVFLADAAEIGDYVNYPVSYDNIQSNTSMGLSTYNGWRVISKNIDLDGNSSPGTVNLVSAGCPLTFELRINSTSSSAAINCLTTNFLTTQFSSEGDVYAYRKTGFLPYKTLTEIFTNKFTAMNVNGITPKVRAMKAEDIYGVTGQSSLSKITEGKYDHLLVIAENYYIATAYNDSRLYMIGSAGSIYSSIGTNGVRPVVSLKPEVVVTGKDVIGAWNIDIPTFDIVFDANGGMGSISSIEVTGRVKYILPECTFTPVDGKVFIGWNVNGEIKLPGDIVTINNHTNIAAVWGDADSKNAEFMFGENSYREVAINNENYIMPDVSATVDKEIGSLQVGSETVYYPIVPLTMSDGLTEHTAAWQALYPVFDNIISITDYANGSVGTDITYNASTTNMPNRLKPVSDLNGAVGAEQIFKYGSSESASSETTAVNNVLYYSSPSVTGAKDAYETVVKWKYTDHAGKIYYYYVGYYADAQTYSGCVTPDTLVKLYDGSTKRIDQITYDDKLLVWDFEKGKYTVTTPAVLYDHGEAYNNVINLTFDDGTKLKLIGIHDLFDADANEYVAINELNVDSYVGHNFVKIDDDTKGYGTTKLVDYTITEEYIGAYSILTAKHLNCITEGMFSRSPSASSSIEDFFDFFEVGENMKYNEEAMKRDIEKYGLYTYEDYKDYVTYEQFIALNGAYFKVLVGKGYITFDDVIEAIDIYVPNNEN